MPNEFIKMINGSNYKFFEPKTLMKAIMFDDVHRPDIDTPKKLTVALLRYEKFKTVEDLKDSLARIMF